MELKGSFLLLQFLFISSIVSDRIQFVNYKLYKLIPNREEHLDFLSALEANSDSVKLISFPSFLDSPVTVLVAPHKQPEFLDILKDNEIAYELVLDNFQKVLDAEQAELLTRSSEYDWTGYHTLEETYNWLRSLEQSYPQYVKTIVVGKSYEGRDVLGVKVSFKEGNKGVFLEGGIHAREWISPATVTYMLNEILTSKDTSVRTNVEKYDWYVFPHTNPDGFAYTHSTNRLWRKTRSKGVRCYGADPNRNWDYHWSEVGTSPDECSDLYAGNSAFSEVEMKALGDFLAKEKDNIRIFLSFHSFGQLMLFPYSWTNSPAPNHDDHQAVGDAFANALAKRYGTKYTVGNSYTTIYPTAGSSDDWVYGVLNIKLSYTIELRPASSFNGFVLPSAQILPTAKETMDGLLALTAKAEELNYFK